MKQALLILTTIGTLALTGCGAWQNNIDKTKQCLSTGNFVVRVWSGALPVATYYVKNGYVNKEIDSDGWFFFVDGKMVRVSGTVTIEQQ